MAENQRTSQLEQQISSINSEYVRSMDQKKKRQRAHLVRLYRRLGVFGVMAALVIGFLGHSLWNSQQALADKQQAKVQVEASLATTLEEQEALELQIAKLNDDEYIGKLLRKDYFLSDENEIIFTLPKDEKDEETNE